MVDSLDIDDDGYPDDKALEQICALKDAPPQALEAFITQDFESLASELSYGRVWSEPDPKWPDKRLIHFATGGWSGCEDFIGAVLSVQMIRALYLEAWKRGGLYTFSVPIKR